MGYMKPVEGEYMSEHPVLFRQRLRRLGRYDLLGIPPKPKTLPSPRPFKILPPNMSSRGSDTSNRSNKSSSTPRQMINALTTHRINTLTELCRIERVAASCDNEADARAFQQPMTTAWVHYVTSNQMLMELRGLTRGFPFCGDIVGEAHRRVRADPDSNRSWNLAWLCLTRMRDDGLVVAYAGLQAVQPEMWGTVQPAQEDIDKLAMCFQREWSAAVETMLRHWPTAPTWY